MDTKSEQDNTLSLDITPQLSGFKKQFEKLFVMTKNGSMRADWLRLQEIQKFIGQCTNMLKMYTGISFKTFQFQQPYKGDLGTVNDNKVKLLQVYAVCFCCYAKACETLSEKPAASYNLFDSLEKIEMSSDQCDDVKVEENKI